MQIAIIGAGPAGLAAAYDFTRANHRVTIFEGGPNVGGLAAGFKAVTRPNEAKLRAFESFAAGGSVDSVVTALARGPSTVWAYLEEYVTTQRLAALDPWVDAETYAKVVDVIAEVGDSYLKPIFEHLAGAVPYEQIRLVVAHRRAQTASRQES